MLALRRLLCTLLVAVTLLLLTPMAVSAQVHEHQDDNGAPMLRSLESLRDLDYQSWQAVAYRTGKPGNPVVLRIVGYPGKLRLEHPSPLLVQAGVKEWQLDDITLENPVLASDGREAASVTTALCVCFFPVCSPKCLFPLMWWGSGVRCKRSLSIHDGGFCR